MSSIKLESNANGTGIFTIASPNSNTNRTLTLPDNTGTIVTTGSSTAVTQSMIGTGVAGTGPAFSAVTSSTISFTLNTWTKIPLQTENFDTANCFDNSTNYRFTPNVAGYYQLNGYLTFNSSRQFAQLRIYKNGSAAGNVIQIGDASGVSLSDIFYMNGTTDYVEVYGFSGSTQNCGGAFSGALVRAA